MFNTGGHGAESGLFPGSSGFADVKIIKEDAELIANAKTKSCRIALNFVTEDSPVVYPHTSDISLCWCYSIMYEHATMLQCLSLAKAINVLIPSAETNE